MSQQKPTELQLGRGRKPRIGTRKPSGMNGSKNCFNWAAVGNRGSASASGKVHIGVFIASIGPRSETADREYPSGTISWADHASIGPRSETADRMCQWLGWEFMRYMLQLGRGRKPRIGWSPSGLVSRPPGCFNWAAVGNRGSADGTKRIIASMLASIGLRSETADRPLGSTPEPPNKPCFNWAAVGNRGSVHQHLRSTGTDVASIGPRSETADR